MFKVQQKSCTIDRSPQNVGPALWVTDSRTCFISPRFVRHSSMASLVHLFRHLKDDCCAGAAKRNAALWHCGGRGRGKVGISCTNPPPSPLFTGWLLFVVWVVECVVRDLCAAPVPTSARWRRSRCSSTMTACTRPRGCSSGTPSSWRYCQPGTCARISTATRCVAGICMCLQLGPGSVEQSCYGRCSCGGVAVAWCALCEGAWGCDGPVKSSVVEAQALYFSKTVKIGAVHNRGVLQGRVFFFFLRTALKDRPKGPPTANRQLPSTANRHQPPTTNRHQPPATNRRQPPAATNRQLPTTANRLQPPTASHQPPPTTINRHQPPVANCQPPTANCHQPWLSTWSARGLFWENWYRNTFFFPVKDTPGAQHLLLCSYPKRGGGGYEYVVANTNEITGNEPCATCVRTVHAVCKLRKVSTCCAHTANGPM